MSSVMDAIYNLPDISFIDDISLEDLQNLLITSFSEKYREATGESIRLENGDPNRIILLAVAQYLYQGLVQIDKAGKMNFLKYSYGDYLVQLAALKGITPLSASKATVSVLWSLEEAREAPTEIPAGTRVTPDNTTYFEVMEDTEIPAGETEKTITMMCTEAGEAGNGFVPGEINLLADPIAFISSVVNTTTSKGGSDTESDEELAERVFLAPTGYSVAGPAGAYRYHAKNYSAAVDDVEVTSPSAGTVKVVFTLDGGEIPTADDISGMLAYLSADERKPLTDYVVVDAPETVSYNITLTYYISRSNQASVAAIQAAVAQAVEEYKAWQRALIGRDINPDELLGRLKAAGIKRAVITSPTYTAITQGQLPICGTVSVTYGGLESD